MKASLHISTQWRDGKTVLNNCFFQPPFKVANITEDKSSATLQLMLMSASPGMLSNDAYEINILVKENTSLQLFTQSYQRLFTMRQQATQSIELRVEKNAAFTFIPHPQVPHKGAVFEGHSTIFLEENASLAWGEIISCGRKFNGEIFEFSGYHSQIHIYKQGQLIIKENQWMQPGIAPVHVLGQMQGFTHQATLIIHCPWHSAEAIISLLLPSLQQEQQIHAGLSAAPGNAVLVRVLGHHAEQLYDLLHRLAALLQLIVKEPSTA